VKLKTVRMKKVMSIICSVDFVLIFFSELLACES